MSKAPASIKPSPAVPERLEYLLATRLAAQRGWLATPRRRLTLALVVSVALHLVAGSFAAFDPPEERSVPLVTRIAKPPPPPVAASAAKAPPKPRRRPLPQTTVAAVAAVMPVLPVEPAADPAPAAPEPAAPEPAAPEPAPAEAPQEPPPPEPLPAPPPPPEPPPPPALAELEPPARLPPKRLDIGYVAYLGEQKFEVGPITLTFRHEEGRYTLRATGRARGLAALMYPGTFSGESQGRITAEGLKPDRFVEERGTPDKRREVIFDYAERLIRLPEKEPLEMKEHAHDPLTWIVQFYFAMPKGEQTSFTVASTRRLDSYTLTRGPDEELAMPVGDADPLTGERRTEPVKTQVWRSVREPDAEGKGGGMAIFWLAPDYHYVPFRVKVVSNAGRSASFELTGIRAE
ncbi:MAG: DUF3108 domain-containing protein [Casimicrobiaceae bacterium]